MSSPTKINSSPVGGREGQRVILREITATLHNSPPSIAHSNKNVNDALSKVAPEHEVKVKFVREFGDAANYPLPPPSQKIAETTSVSLASSFQSLTSTLSTKSSSGICIDNTLESNDSSYADLNVSGLDDIISACSAINLSNASISEEQSLTDATFTSATNELNQTRDLSESFCISPKVDNLNATQISKINLDVTEVLNGQHSPDLNLTLDINDENIDDNSQLSVHIKPTADYNFSPEDDVTNDTYFESIPLASDVEKDNQELDNVSDVFLPSGIIVKVIEPSPIKGEVNNTKILQDIEKAPDITSCASTIQNILLEEESAFEISSSAQGDFVVDSAPSPRESLSITPVEIATQDLAEVNGQKFVDKLDSLAEPTLQSDIIESVSSKNNCDISAEQSNQEKSQLSSEITIKHSISESCRDKLDSSIYTDTDVISAVSITATEEKETNNQSFKDLDTTVNINSTINTNLFDPTDVERFEKSLIENHIENIETIQPTQVEYDQFLPSRQSTRLYDLPPPSDINTELSPEKNSEISKSEFFDSHNLSIIDKEITIEKSKLEEENKNSASTDLWCDSQSFDFLLSKKTNSATIDRLRAESFYVKFDPLVSNTSMLPQGNGATAPQSEDRNGEKDASVPNIETPKRNPAIAAIDRLLFYSPMSPSNQKTEEPKKIEPTEKTTPEPVPVVNSIMAEELELVRATVLQLEEQLEKQKLAQQQQEKEHKVDREAFQEAITQLQKQLNQEIKSKNQINVVVDEYEKSISRLVAERERDRKNLDVEKASLLEELQEVKNHLAASEAAFNDVHAKYERLKVVVTASKNNEAALKASIAENVEIIKTLEDRYDQIKEHANVRLTEANLELKNICKQHESETLKLRAMLRKEELKSNSLAEMIEQKTKENKELTKILDEVIARVDPDADK